MLHAEGMEELHLSHEEVPLCSQCLEEEQEEDMVTSMASMPAVAEERTGQEAWEGRTDQAEHALVTVSNQDPVVTHLTQGVGEGSEQVKPRLDKVNMGCNFHTLAPASTMAREGLVVVVVPILHRSVEVGTEGTAVVATRLILFPAANHTDGTG